MSRKPYSGKVAKLVLAFDIGTTHSGISYCIQTPGQIPEVKGVQKFPFQETVKGDSKIPTVLLYDPAGKSTACGAQVFDEEFAALAKESGYHKVEWFKLHMRPDRMPGFFVQAEDIPPLPEGVTVVDVFADFISYLYDCAQTYIIETSANGASLWKSLAPGADFVMTHPNGWTGSEQQQLRRAAVMSGIITDSLKDHDRLRFVTEGEASLHFCINSAQPDTFKNRSGIMIIDAGGGTVDINTYRYRRLQDRYVETSTAECHAQGSIFVTRRATDYFENAFRGTKYAEDVPDMAAAFDGSTKLIFRNQHLPYYIKFGGHRDQDSSLAVNNGRLTVEGESMARFFDPSLRCILDAIERLKVNNPVSSICFVGGFAANRWLYEQLSVTLAQIAVDFYRPNSHINKAACNGAIIYYLNNMVSARVARFTYGCVVQTKFHRRKEDHQDRAHTVITRPSGTQVIPGFFSQILRKGIAVLESRRFTQPFFLELPAQFSPSDLELDKTIFCYTGHHASAPEWRDVDPDGFHAICVIKANLTELTPALLEGTAPFYVEYKVVLTFGLPELKAEITWRERGVEKRGPARIIYNFTNDEGDAGVV